MTQPPVSVETLPAGSIDISPLLSKQAAERTDLEREIIAVSSCNQAHLFEEQDLYSTSPCSAHVPDFRAKGLGAMPLFAHYRELLIDYYLKTQTPQLRGLFQGEGLNTFIKVVAEHSKGVTDIPGLLKGLQNLLLAWKDEYNEKGLLLLALPWLVLHNLAALDRARVQAGRASILPAGEMDRFEKTIKGLLEAKLLRMGAQSETGPFEAEYDAQNNTLLLPTSWVDRPLKNSTEIANIMPHELYHAFQDEEKRRGTLADAEVEAYLVGIKGLILMRGLVEARAFLVHVQEQQTKALQEISVYQGDKEEARVRSFVIRYFVNHTSKSYDDKITLGGIFDFEKACFKLAHRELESGKIDQEGRKQLSYLHASHRQILVDCLGDIGEHSSFLISDRIRLGNAAFETKRQKAYEDFKQGKLWDVQRISIAGDGIRHEYPVVPKEYLGVRLMQAQRIESLFLVYHFEGEQAAETYLAKSVLPSFLGPRAIVAFMKVPYLTNGITPNARQK
ncbi:MAG: hypothetical protein HYU97_09120 [Deltaproteobacteria bacterium]|nr:hypothetical protein [Deltaproteobacteria bacterium]